MLSVSVRIAPCPDAAPCVDGAACVNGGRFDLARPTSDISPLRNRHSNLTATRASQPEFVPYRNAAFLFSAVCTRSPLIATGKAGEVQVALEAVHSCGIFASPAPRRPLHPCCQLLRHNQKFPKKTSRYFPVACATLHLRLLLLYRLWYVRSVARSHLRPFFTPIGGP